MNVLATQRGSAHYPSMLEDVEAHRRTEIDMITGALVREADRLGVPVPLHKTMERLIKAKEASLGMKVCVVGCGAVGSLFAANLATLDDVEVWAYDLAQEHVDAINRDGLRLTGAGEVTSDGRARRPTRRSCPPCDFGIVATKAMHTEPAIARDRARVRRRLRRDRAERDRQRGGARRARRARDPRHDLPRREDHRARRRAVGRQGRHDVRAVRGAAGAVRRGRAPRRRVHARRHADEGGRGRARPAVAQGDLQRRHEPARRADRAHARPRLRAAAAPPARHRSSSTRARRSRRRRASCSTPTPRN